MEFYLIRPPGNNPLEILGTHDSAHSRSSVASFLGYDNRILDKVLSGRSDNHLSCFFVSHQFLGLFRILSPKGRCIFYLHYVIIDVDIDWAFGFTPNHDTVPPCLLQVDSKVSSAVRMADSPRLSALGRNVITAR